MTPGKFFCGTLKIRETKSLQTKVFSAFIYFSVSKMKEDFFSGSRLFRVGCFWFHLHLSSKEGLKFMESGYSFELQPSDLHAPKWLILAGVFFPSAKNTFGGLYQNTRDFATKSGSCAILEHRSFFGVFIYLDVTFFGDRQVDFSRFASSAFGSCHTSDPAGFRRLHQISVAGILMWCLCDSGERGPLIAALELHGNKNQPRTSPVGEETGQR